MLDDLERSPGAGSDHRQPARHRLQQDESERLVVAAVKEHPRSLQGFRDVAAEAAEADAVAKPRIPLDTTLELVRELVVLAPVLRLANDPQPELGRSSRHAFGDVDREVGPLRRGDVPEDHGVSGSRIDLGRAEAAGVNPRRNHRHPLPELGLGAGVLGDVVRDRDDRVREPGDQRDEQAHRSSRGKAIRHVPDDPTPQSQRAHRGDHPGSNGGSVDDRAIRVLPDQCTQVARGQDPAHRRAHRLECSATVAEHSERQRRRFDALGSRELLGGRFRRAHKKSVRIGSQQRQVE